MAQDDLKVEYYLWQLHHIDQEAKRKRAEKEEQEANIKRLQDAHRDAEAGVGAAALLPVVHAPGLAVSRAAMALCDRGLQAEHHRLLYCGNSPWRDRAIGSCRSTRRSGRRQSSRRSACCWSARSPGSASRSTRRCQAAQCMAQQSACSMVPDAACKSGGGSPQMPAHCTHGFPR